MMETRAAHVALVAFPFTSHAGSLLLLARQLTCMVEDVSFSFFTTAVSAASLSTMITDCKDTTKLSFYSLPDGLPESFTFAPERPDEPIQHFMRSAPYHLRQALSDLSPLSCILSDSLLCFTQDLADELGVPRISFWASGASSLSSHVYTDLIRDTVGICELTPENKESPVDCIPGLPFLRLQDLPEGVVFGRLDSPFSLLLYDMARTSARSVAVIFNTFESFETFTLAGLRTKLQQACLSVGPLPLPTSSTDSHGCLPFLDSHPPNSVVYISFGNITDRFLPKHELAAIAEGLESSGAPFLWSLKPELHAHLPSGFIDQVKGRGLLVPWAPQRAVLSHASTGAHFTHCGWNSVLDSLVGGMAPLISRPLFADQGLICRLVECVFGIGLRLREGTCTQASVVEAMHLVLHGEEGKEMRKKLKQWKHLAQEAVGPGGSSFENMKALVGMMKGKKGDTVRLVS